jgi:2-polyprenyl-6-methoxyphenol hydroxylase-like FAD-dependent oxidoreductase
MHAEGLGGLCLGHPATCDIFAQLATAAGATLLRGAGDISVTSGSRPIVSCVHDGASVEFRPRLVIGADGRNSSVRKDLSFKVNRDEPRALLGGYASQRRAVMATRHASGRRRGPLPLPDFSAGRRSSSSLW